MRSDLLSCFLLSSVLIACGGDSFSSSAASAGAGGAGQAGASGLSGSAGQSGAAGSGAGQGGSGDGGAGGSASGQGGAGAGGGSAGEGGAGQGGAAGQAGAGGSAGQSGAAGEAGSGGAAAGSGGAPGGSAGAPAGAGGAPAGAGGAPAGGASGSAPGGAGQGGGGAPAGAGGAGGSGPGGIIYVNPNEGNDSLDGLSPASAVLSLKVAASLAGGKVSEIRACGGSQKLTETLVLPAGVALRGGFDCATFSAQAQLASSFGGKAACNSNIFDPALSQVTKIEVSNSVSPVIRMTGVGGRLEQVVITGQTVGVSLENTQGASIERSQIRVFSAGQDSPTKAVSIIGGDPLLTNNCIQGGGGKATALEALGSAGVLVAGGAKARLENNAVSGGSGDGDAFGTGSCGVAVYNASAALSGNSVIGGNGTTSAAGAVASAGVLIVSEGAGGKLDIKIAGNSLQGGSGKANIFSARSSIGLGVLCKAKSANCSGFSKLLVDSNSIHGGSGVGSSDGTAVFSQVAASFQDATPNPPEAQQLEFTNNHVTGGTASVGPRGSIGVFVIGMGGTIARNDILAGKDIGAALSSGVWLRSTRGMLVESNMIHAGLVGSSNAGLRSEGVTLEVDQDTRLWHNTVSLSNDAKEARGIAMRVADGKTQRVSIENNLLLGNDKSSSRGVEFVECPVDAALAFRGNSFVNFPGRSFYGHYNDPNCFGNDYVAGMKDFEAKIGVLAASNTKTLKFAMLGDNIEPANTCAVGDIACRKLSGCTNQDSCGAALFENWHAASDGADDLTTIGGWKVRTTLPCGVVQSSQFYDGKDRFNHDRTDPGARGAYEQDACPQPSQ